MNLISYDAAYSLYPRATFHERVTLVTKRKTFPLSPVMLKWAERGWDPIKSFSPDWMSEHRYSLAFPTQPRWIDDVHGWKIGLDMTGVTPPAPFSRLSPQLSRDPIMCTNWALVKDQDGFYPTIYYKLARATWLHLKYALCDDALIQELTAAAWRMTAAENAKESYAVALAAMEGRDEQGAKELLNELRVWSVSTFFFSLEDYVSLNIVFDDRSDADFPMLCASYRAKGFTRPPGQNDHHLYQVSDNMTYLVTSRLTSMIARRGLAGFYSPKFDFVILRLRLLIIMTKLNYQKSKLTAVTSNFLPASLRNVGSFS